MCSEGWFAGFNGNPAARSEAIEACERELGIRLPDDYREFLLCANGGEGLVGNVYVIFWRADELAQLNREYEVEVDAPGLLLLGSNGGGEAFAFDCQSSGMPVVSVPFVGMHREHIQAQGSDFAAFLRGAFLATDDSVAEGEGLRAMDRAVQGTEILEIHPKILGR